MENLYKNGIKCPQAETCGELLSMILMKGWPTTSAGSELSTLGVLRHVLSWKLWPGYFEFLGKLDKACVLLISFQLFQGIVEI